MQSEREKKPKRDEIEEDREKKAEDTRGKSEADDKRPEKQMKEREEEVEDTRGEREERR